MAVAVTYAATKCVLDVMVKILTDLMRLFVEIYCLGLSHIQCGSFLLKEYIYEKNRI